MTSTPDKKPAHARPGPHGWLVWASLSMSALPVWSQVYKWVDEQGRTHYGQSKPQASQASTTELQLHKAPPSAAQAASSTRPAVPPEHRRAFAPPTSSVKAPEVPSTRPPRSRSGGREDGSDASRCALAQDVLSGAVRHSNGKPTDSYDIDVANNDVRMFCR